MQAKLVVVSGGPANSEITVRLPAVIGRSREANLTVPHPQVSRRHCELVERDGLLIVRDLKSTNGTLIDGRRVAEAPLVPESQFTVGPLTLRAVYEYEGDPAAVPAAQFADEEQQPAKPHVPETVTFEPAAEAADEAAESEAPAAATEEESFEWSLDEEEESPQTEAVAESPAAIPEPLSFDEAESEDEQSEPAPSPPPSLSRRDPEEPAPSPPPAVSADAGENGKSSAPRQPAPAPAAASEEKPAASSSAAVPSEEEEDEAFEGFLSDLK
jgi:pilus assembly protein CpaF